MYAALDILTLAILGLCIWQGYKKGFIMSLAGVLILVAALAVAGFAAEKYADQIGGHLEPYVGWLSTDAADESIRDAGGKEVQSDAEKALLAISKSFEKLGVSGDAADKLAEKTADMIQDKNLSIRNGISRVFTDTLSYILIFVLIFVVTALLLTVIANIVNAAFGLPVLNALNKFGGIGLGALYGLIIIFALTWLLRFTGMLVSQETLENTWFVRLFMNINPIKAMLGF